MIILMQKLHCGRTFGILLLILSLWNGIVRADPNDESYPSSIESDLQAGAAAIYRLQFQSAESHLRHAIQVQPNHPAPYFFLAMLRWYQLTYDSLLYRDVSMEKLFEEQTNLAESVAKRFKKKEGRSIGYLYMAGSLGAKGWYHVVRHQWIRAYFSGKKGYSYLLKAVDEEPELYDAYLGLGMYEYYASTLGPTLKILASFYIHADKEEAIHKLKLAEYKSRYVRLEASYFLWNSSIDEGRLHEAWEEVNLLNRSIPDSPLFKWCEIQTLFYEKNWAAVLHKGEIYSRTALMAPQPEHYIDPYTLLLAKVQYHSGLAAFNLKNFSLARTYFEKTQRQSAQFVGWRVMATLRLGEISDLKGNREEAIEKYREVLNMPNFWNSHKMAHERIKEPFHFDSTQEVPILNSPLQNWNTEL